MIKMIPRMRKLKEGLLTAKPNTTHPSKRLKSKFYLKRMKKKKKFLIIRKEETLMTTKSVL